MSTRYTARTVPAAAPEYFSLAERLENRPVTFHGPAGSAHPSAPLFILGGTILRHKSAHLREMKIVQGRLHDDPYFVFPFIDNVLLHRQSKSHESPDRAIRALQVVSLLAIPPARGGPNDDKGAIRGLLPAHFMEDSLAQLELEDLLQPEQDQGLPELWMAMYPRVAQALAAKFPNNPIRLLLGDDPLDIALNLLWAESGLIVGFPSIHINVFRRFAERSPLWTTDSWQDKSPAAPRSRWSVRHLKHGSPSLLERAFHPSIEKILGKGPAIRGDIKAAALSFDTNSISLVHRGYPFRQALLEVGSAKVRPPRVVLAATMLFETVKSPLPAGASDATKIMREKLEELCRFERTSLEDGREVLVAIAKDNTPPYTPIESKVRDLPQAATTHVEALRTRLPEPLADRVIRLELHNHELRVKQRVVLVTNDGRMASAWLHMGKHVLFGPRWLIPPQGPELARLIVGVDKVLAKHYGDEKRPGWRERTVQRFTPAGRSGH